MKLDQSQNKELYRFKQAISKLKNVIRAKDTQIFKLEKNLKKFKKSKRHNNLFNDQIFSNTIDQIVMAKSNSNIFILIVILIENNFSNKFILFPAKNKNSSKCDFTSFRFLK